MSKFEKVDRIIRPRREDGSDWNSERIVLVRSGERELWWWKSRKSWEGRTCGYKHQPGVLMLRKKGDVLGKELCEGGRLSKEMILSHTRAINEFFGCEVVSEIDIKKTVLVKGD